LGGGNVGRLMVIDDEGDDAEEMMMVMRNA
jgi:hypothetical protein